MTSHMAIIGGGPAGLMAAEVLTSAGRRVTVYEQKPSLGRKFLMAGRGGLNLTHSEDLPGFMQKYGAAAEYLAPAIKNFTPQMLRDWCEGLGQETFVGTSGRIFPKAFKASPLLRAWLSRLEKLGVQFKLQYHWQGWEEGNLVFTKADGARELVKSAATLLALGGASWPRLGSDGSWVDILSRANIPITPLRPANCGFIVNWTDIFRTRFAGQPLKPVKLSFSGKNIPGELMITQTGLEGGPLYALSADIRDVIAAHGAQTLYLDLRPGLSIDDLTKKLQRPRGALSLTNYLQKVAGLSPVAIGLIMEQPNRKEIGNYSAEKLAALMKALPVQLTAPASIDRAISTAGGIPFTAIDEKFMLKALPGVFVAGEMLDWEAPTGGYLLQACFATAVAAAEGMRHFK